MKAVGWLSGAGYQINIIGEHMVKDRLKELQAQKAKEEKVLAKMDKALDKADAARDKQVAKIAGIGARIDRLENPPDDHTTTQKP